MATRRNLGATALLCTLAVICAQPVRAADPQFRVVDLGSLDGSGPRAFSAAGVINDRGDVGGYTAAYTVASVWSLEGVRRDLPTPQGARITYIGALSDSGQVVGELSGPAGGAMLHDGIAPTILAPGAFTRAHDINAAGQIVGGLDGGARPFLYEGGMLTELSGGPPTFLSAATDINDSGLILGEWQVVVTTENQISTVESTFLYQDGQYRDLGRVDGAGSSLAMGLNNDGLVLANLGLRDGWRAHTWFDGSWTDLGTLRGAADSYAWALGESGAVVGQSGNRAFLYQAGMMFDLTQQLEPGSGWTLTSAVGINSSGQIAANGCRDGVCRALRLDPVPPVPLPSSAGLLAAGLAYLAMRRRGINRSAA